jgi:hypothetical protein
MKRYIVILIVCIITSGLASWFLSASLTKRASETQFATIELYEMANDPRVSNVLNGPSITDNAEFDHAFFAKVMTIAIFHPAISSLDGAPLKTLCRLIVYKEKGGFSALGDTDIKQIIDNYLVSQKQDVINQLHQPQHNLQKARQILVTEGVITPEMLKMINDRDQMNAAAVDLCK